jgi:cell division protein FtsI (penicillin-binding protein 3)
MKKTFFVCFALLFVVFLRVGYLQVVKADHYQQASLDQRLRNNTIKADRGVIFDRDGNELALSVPSVTVFADPTYVVDPITTASTLASVLRLTPKEEKALAKELAATDDNFVYVARQLNEDMAEAVTALNLAGIYSYSEPTRVVAGEVARNIIGRTDPDGIGTSGLESQFDEVLTGVDGRQVIERDSDGRSIPSTRSIEREPEAGQDLVLTINRSMQFQTDAALLQRVAELKARGGNAIVMNSKTGEIYAISSIRRLDTGVYTTSPGNLSAVEAYEPGSVAKVISVAAAINENRVTDKSVFSVPGWQRFDDFTIRDAFPHDLQQMTVREILTQSSNLGTVLISQEIPTETLYSYIKAFGFGAKTDLNFPNESAGLLRDVEDWRGTEKLTVAYGYGFASTSLQLVAAVNVIANGGEYVAPKLVKATIDGDGNVKDTAPSETHRVLTPDTSSMMLSIMKDVVCLGTGTRAQVELMNVAGKTGTGYKVQQNGTYNTNDGGRKYFASFVGFFPADNPEVTILVSIDEPDPSSQDRFGGTAAAPAFARLAQVAIRELQIQPTTNHDGCPANVEVVGH